MKKDFSWERTAQGYEKLLEELKGKPSQH